MSWDGTERRQNQQPIHCLHAEDWGALKEVVVNLDKRINGSLDHMAKHIDDGKMWRATIVGIVMSLALQATAFVYAWSRVTYRVEINTKLLETLHNDMDSMKLHSYGYQDYIKGTNERDTVSEVQK